MNILLGAHGFPPNQMGGAEWRAHRTAMWLSQRGHSVRVLAIDKTSSPQANPVEVTEEMAGPVRTYRLSYNLDQRWGTGAEYDNPIARQTLAKLLAREPVDVFHVISGYRLTGSVLQAARAAGVPTLLTLTDFWFLCPRIVLYRPSGQLCSGPEDPWDCVLCWLESRRRFRLPIRLTRGAAGDLLKWCWRKNSFAAGSSACDMRTIVATRHQFQIERLRETDLLIAPSKFLAELFAAQGIDRSRISVMRQGVDMPAQAARPDYRPGPPLVFGYVGRLDSHKGIELLVKAFRRLPYGVDRIKLCIYGDPAQAWPPFWTRLQRAAGHDPRIRFVGTFPRSQAGSVYRGLDALVVPSTWYENSPNVILEAFASGVPVIASNIGGMAELVQPGMNGALFEAGSVEGLRACLAEIIKQPDQLLHWRAGIAPIKTLDEEMQDLEKVYCGIA